MTASDSKAHDRRQRSASKKNGGNIVTSRGQQSGSAMRQPVNSSGLKSCDGSAGDAFTQTTVTVNTVATEVVESEPTQPFLQSNIHSPSILPPATQQRNARSMGSAQEHTIQQAGRFNEDGTAQEIIHAGLCAWLQAHRGPIWAYCFDKATLTPPITKQSLSELDIGAIINNPKLRHDVNFDRELHFRPNFDGYKGRHKMKVAEEYWRALAGELDLYSTILGAGCDALLLYGFSQQEILRATSRRLPTMFDTIREILKNLVPERDQGRVDEGLDTRMLMQKIEKGVCDLAALAEWTSLLLKTHCAPMRDEMVDEMVSQVRLGVADNQSGYIVSGLQKLLGILEAMKLDVANHQIRHLRPLLIDDTTNFERKSQEARINRKRVRTSEAREWLRNTATSNLLRIPDLDVQVPSVDSLTAAVISELLSTAHTEAFPDPFYLDFDRLRALKTDLRDLISFDICLETFRALLEQQPCGPSMLPIGEQVLRTRLIALVSSGNVDDRRDWIGNIGNIAVELLRLAHSSDGSIFTPAAGSVQKVEKELHRLLQCNSEVSDCFSKHAGRLAHRLYGGVSTTISNHGYASPIDLFNAFVSPSAPPPPPPPPSATVGTARRALANESHSESQTDHLDDLVRRTAHIIILHWRIWSELVYLKSEQTQQDAITPLTQAASTEALQEAWVVDGGQSAESDGEGETESGLILHATSSNESATSSTAPRPINALPFHHHPPPHRPG